MNKYSTKRSHHTATFDSYNNASNNNSSSSSGSKPRRDYSPGDRGRGRSPSRTSSPDGSWSPRGGSYSSTRYSSTRRSKERDSSSSKYYDGGGGSKSKYMRLSPHESGKSSVGVKSSSSNYKDYMYNNGHTSSSSKKSYFGDWSEQISSSGKRYYYNSKTETSQWEKPKEWAEWEKRHSSSRYSSSSSSKHHHHHRDKTNDNNIDSNNPKSYSYLNNDLLSSSSSSCHRDHLHHNHNHHHNNGKLKDSSSYSNSRYDSPSSSRSHYDRISNKSSGDKSRLLSHNNHDGHDDVDDDQHDDKKSTSTILKMAVDDCSNHNDRSSTNQSSHSHCNNNHSVYKSDSVKLNLHHQQQQKTNCDSPSISHHGEAEAANLSSIVSLMASIFASGQSSPQNLSKLLSQLNNCQGLNLGNRNLTREEATELLTKTVHLSQQKSQQNQMNNVKPTLESAATATRLNSVAGVGSHHHHHHQQQVNESNSQCKRDPSNKANCHRADGGSLIRQADLVEQISKKFAPSSSSSSTTSASVQVTASPVASTANVDKNKSNNDNNVTTSSLTTISSIGSTISQKSSVPNLSRFKHLYREDLIDHVSGWYSEQLDKQANVLFKQANHIGNHLATKVSAELKSARSAVRAWEIRTTLQKQRILFTRQQIKTVEEWRGKQFGPSSSGGGSGSIANTTAASSSSNNFTS